MDLKGIKEHYKKRMTEICGQEVIKGQIVLLGDCVIEYFDSEKHFPNMNIINNGISGDTTQQLQDTLYKRAIKFKPSKLFIAVGSNDFGFEGKSVRDVYNKIEEIVLELKKRTKDTEIYLFSVLPVNPANISYINREYVDSRDNYEINMLNYYLRNYSRKNNITFVDVKKILATSFDQLDLSYTVDGFHLNETGYSEFSKVMREYM